MKTITIAPPNAVVFVFDPEHQHVQIPTTMAGQIVASSDSCVAIGTQASVDGDVTISLATAASPTEVSGLQRVFCEKLQAPSRRLGLVTSEITVLLDCEVSTETPYVEIWVDDRRWPSRIVATAA